MQKACTECFAKSVRSLVKANHEDEEPSRKRQRREKLQSLVEEFSDTKYAVQRCDGDWNIPLECLFETQFITDDENPWTIAENVALIHPPRLLPNHFLHEEMRYVKKRTRGTKSPKRCNRCKASLVCQVAFTHANGQL